MLLNFGLKLQQVGQKMILAVKDIANADAISPRFSYKRIGAFQLCMKLR